MVWGAGGGGGGGGEDSFLFIEEIVVSNSIYSKLQHLIQVYIKGFFVLI